jgi:hypothetical protein
MEFKAWEDMTVLEQYQSAFWDIYKDAYGVRPRGIDTSSWTEQDFEAEFSRLHDIIAEEYTASVKAEKKAIKAFESRIANMMRLHSITRVDAVRWIMQAEDCEGDPEHFCWSQGLPFDYLNKDSI